MLVGLGVANLVTAALAMAVMPGPTERAAALLAWGLGLRHALDADHIVAIDNAVRRMLGRDRDPIAAGLWFALGHSSVVFALCGFLIIAAAPVAKALTVFGSTAGVIGALVSITVLVLLASGNLRMMLKSRDPASSSTPVPAGIVGMLVVRTMRWVGRPWHLYPVGMLMGLGFDTATEIGLLGLTTVQQARGVAWPTLLLLPLLFATGMASVDGLDSMAMTRIYAAPGKRSRAARGFNLVVTALSAVLAFAVAFKEALSLALDNNVRIPTALQVLANLDPTALGASIAALFGVCWLVWIGLKAGAPARATAPEPAR